MRSVTEAAGLLDLGRIFAVPVVLPQYDVKQHWHERFHNDRGSQWLRRVIADLISTKRSATQSLAAELKPLRLGVH